MSMTTDEKTPSRLIARTRVLGAGLGEVIVGADPAVGWRSSRIRRAATFATIIGVVVVLAAIAGIAVSMRVPLGTGGLGQVFTSYLSPRAGHIVFQESLAPRGVAVKTASFGSMDSLALFKWSAFGLVGLGPLFLAWRYPLFAWRVGFVAALIVPVLTMSPISALPPDLQLPPEQLLLLVAVLCVAGLRHSRATLWWLWALMALPAWIWLGPGLLKPLAGEVALMVITVALDATGASHRARRELAAQFERTELEGARRAVLEERTRIAREMHDVVAHHMSLIAVQAETAPFRLNELPDSALDEFSSLSEHAREALSDMRRLLGALRNEGPAERAPQPRLDDVPDLVAASQRAGVDITLIMPDIDTVTSPGVELCAYRIVQEALSNANRHALGSEISVTLEGDTDALRLRVRNGPGVGQTAISGYSRAGHGLVGMSERVAMLGGELVAAEDSEGGFLVAAVLPLHSALVSPAS
ncbi:MAG TPA: sensor histidine kinase [Acidimicrobiales bacterium]|jgi:signal transduction histidine kinase|nr:sensor histidine kinase [Acidimicrobiales bacterium]